MKKVLKIFLRVLFALLIVIVLFRAGECSQIIGEAFQQDHMKYFPRAEMHVIKDAGHTMFGEKPGESLEIIKTYFTE